MPFGTGGMGSIPGPGAEILHALKPRNQIIKKKKKFVTNSVKTLKMVHIKKNLKKKEYNWIR